MACRRGHARVRPTPAATRSESAAAWQAPRDERAAAGRRLDGHARGATNYRHCRPSDERRERAGGEARCERRTKTRARGDPPHPWRGGRLVAGKPAPPRQARGETAQPSAQDKSGAREGRGDGRPPPPRPLTTTAGWGGAAPRGPSPPIPAAVATGGGGGGKEGDSPSTRQLDWKGGGGGAERTGRPQSDTAACRHRSHPACSDSDRPPSRLGNTTARHTGRTPPPAVADCHPSGGKTRSLPPPASRPLTSAA